MVKNLPSRAISISSPLSTTAQHSTACDDRSGLRTHRSAARHTNEKPLHHTGEAVIIFPPFSRFYHLLSLLLYSALCGRSHRHSFTSSSRTRQRAYTPPLHASALSPTCRDLPATCSLPSTTLATSNYTSNNTPWIGLRSFSFS